MNWLVASRAPDGNACVCTTTLGIGSGVWLPGLGVHLNSMLGEMELITADPRPGDPVPSYATRTDYRPGDSVPLVLDGQTVAHIPVDDLLG